MFADHGINAIPVLRVLGCNAESARLKPAATKPGRDLRFTRCWPRLAGGDLVRRLARIP